MTDPSVTVTSLTGLLSVFAFAVVATATPGPNNLMMLSSGLNFGIARSLPHLLGICLGFPTMMIAVSLGLGALFTNLPWLQNTLKLLAGSYLLYLAYRIATTDSGLQAPEHARPFTFVQAALFQWVNPKAWMMSISALAAFTSHGSEVATQSLAVAAVFCSVGFPCVGAWLIGGSWLKRWLSGRRQRHYFNRMMALLLIVSVAPMLTSALTTIT